MKITLLFESHLELQVLVRRYLRDWRRQIAQSRLLLSLTYIWAVIFQGQHELISDKKKSSIVMASSSENGHMWKSVTKWITSLEVLPPNKINSCQDLAYSLRDGVILCHIASRLDEASISLKSINHKTQMAQFLSLQNIRLFLNACKVAFGLNESELFDPSMLW